MGKCSVGLGAEKESTVELVRFDRVCSVTLVMLATLNISCSNSSLTTPSLGTGWSSLALILLGTGPVATGKKTSCPFILWRGVPVPSKGVLETDAIFYITSQLTFVMTRRLGWSPRSCDRVTWRIAVLCFVLRPWLGRGSRDRLCSRWTCTCQAGCRLLDSRD